MLRKCLVSSSDKHQISEAINDGTIFSCPSLLASFCIICFADLKKYKFTYHFGFPALQMQSPWLIGATNGESKANDLEHESHNLSRLSSDESTALVDKVQTWRYSVDSRQHGFFLAKKVQQAGSSYADAHETESPRPPTPLSPGSNLGFHWAVGSLESYEHGFFDRVNPQDQYICFADPSTYPSNPGWMLRNLLVLIHRRWNLDHAQILCYRDTQARRHEANSLILQIRLAISNADRSSSRVDTTPNELLKVTGWEKSSAGKLVSKIANLGGYMDPQR